MANYDAITGYIEKIYEGATSSGKEYLGIKFYTNDAHQNESYPEIKLWFSSQKAKEISQEKIERLFDFAGIPFTGKKPATVKEAVNVLAREEFVALPIQITVQPNEWEGVIRAQYDVGWLSGGDYGVVEDGLNKFADLLAERMAEIKAGATKNTPKVHSDIYDDDDTPF
jgi:hypothetical protein